MLKIGDFSKLGQVSVKLLRRYDQLGLLPPARVDQQTGYRYYSAQQILDLNRIQVFRELGFTLQEIGSLLNEDLPPALIRKLLGSKQAEIKQLMGVQQARMARIEARIRQIEREGALSAYEVALKHVAPQAVASIRAVIAPAQVPHLFAELDAYLNYYGITQSRPHSVLWHDTHSQRGHMDIEVSCVLTQPLPSSRQVTIRTLPEVATMACVMHLCRPGTSCDACATVDSWIEEHHYCFSAASAAREVYWFQEDACDSFYLAEIQLPVVKSEVSP